MGSGPALAADELPARDAAGAKQEGDMTHSEELLSPDFELFGLKRPGSGVSTPPAPPRREIISLELSLITPMFGGSAEAGQVDPDRPVNAKSIRGHLRFWWRACRAHLYQDPHTMFQDEARLFGQSATEVTDDGKRLTIGPGCVDISVSCHHVTIAETNGLKKREPTGYKDRKEQWKWTPQATYALFPFIEGNPNPPYTEKLRFSLCINCADSAVQQLIRALSAWVHLGGIGARTRRGCGSLRLVCSSHNLLTLDDLVCAIQNEGQDYRPGGTPRLKGALLLRQANGRRPDHWKCWLDTVDVLRSFRQIPYGRKDHNSQSNWPETDAIRRYAGGTRYRHPARSSMPDYYPRADLGLPIIFEFKDDPAPPKHTLSLQEYDRMASPIITKAFPIAENLSESLIVVIDTPHVWVMGTGKLEPESKSANPIPLSGVRFEGPLKVNGKTYPNARDAFVAFAREVKKFKEVTL
jgi:CRISPR-associated protein Cmr1